MTLVENMRALRRAQKSSSGAPAYSRFINRPMGRFFAAAAHSLGLAPDQVTALSGFCTFAGIATIALVAPTPMSSLVIVALLVIGYALDSADGQLARLRGGGSLRGEWLDHVVDATKMSTIHLAVLVCWARFYDVAAGWLLVPIAFAVVSMIFFFGVILTDLLRRIASASTPPRDEPAPERKLRASPLYSVAVLPADYGLLMLVFVTVALPPVFMTLYTALLAVNALILAASLVRWFRSLPAEAVARA